MIPRPSPAAPVLASIVACAALSLSACAGAADASDTNHPLMGKPAPEISAEAVGGDGPTSLKAAQGKVVILDFWGTYCDPCKKSFPKYQALVDQFGGQVVVLAVSVDDPEMVKKDKLVAFARDNQAKFAIVWDKGHSAAKTYGLDTLTVPSSFVIDKQGVVRHLHVGFHPGEEAKIAGEVKDLLK